MKWIKKVATTPLGAIAKVIDSLTSGVNERSNAPSIHAVNEALALKQDFLNFDSKPTSGSENPVTSGGLLEYLKGEFLETVYPVGSVYLTTSESVNPATLFGGTWERESGKYIYAGGEDNDHRVNNRGGNKNYIYTPEGTVEPHKLTVDEIPEHRHTYGLASAQTAQTFSAGQSGGVVGINTTETTTGASGSGANHSHGFEGTTAAIELNPEYYCVALWRRVA